MAWFQEKWVLRHAGGKGMIRDDADALYDSIAIPHDDRWDLPLPTREETLRYIGTVQDGVLERLDNGPTEEEVYHTLYAVFHEDMHTEAFTYTRQTLAYPSPRFSIPSEALPGGGPLAGDVEIPGGTFMLGATQDEPFVFDNEKWAHPVEIKPFAIARAPVTQAEFAAFVDDGGYRRQDLWCQDGWQWRTLESAEHPVYWRPDTGGGWLRRDFDTSVSLEPHRPVIHVNGYEAGAYCRWSKRRLPSEAEWEAAASAESDLGLKRRFPWGDDPPSPARAQFDWQNLGCAEVGPPTGDQQQEGRATAPRRDSRRSRFRPHRFRSGSPLSTG